MQTSEILDRAADLIQERGWGQGPASMLGTGGICAMGAIYLAKFGEVGDDYLATHFCSAGQAVYRYLIEAGFEDDGQDTIWEWNDDQAEGSRVIEVLRACAVIEASREREAAEVSPEAVSA